MSLSHDEALALIRCTSTEMVNTVRLIEAISNEHSQFDPRLKDLRTRIAACKRGVQAACHVLMWCHIELKTKPDDLETILRRAEIPEPFVKMILKGYRRARSE